MHQKVKDWILQNMSESSCRNGTMSRLIVAWKKGQQWDWGNRNVFELCLGGNNIEGLVTGKSRRSQRCSSNFHLWPKRDGGLFPLKQKQKHESRLLMKSTILAFVLLGVWVIFRIFRWRYHWMHKSGGQEELSIKVNEQGSSIKVWPQDHVAGNHQGPGGSHTWDLGRDHSAWIPGLIYRLQGLALFPVLPRVAKCTCIILFSFMAKLLYFLNALFT